METELIKTISSIPFDMYKSRYYVSNSIDAYRNLWEIYYRKSKKSKYWWNAFTSHGSRKRKRRKN